MTDEAIRSWLGSPAMVPGWDGQRGNWQDWLTSILTTFFAEADAFNGKRPNCDSCWWHPLAMSLCMVDADVADIYAYNALVVARTTESSDGEPDWDVVDQLEAKVYDSFDSTRAIHAFDAVVEYLFRSRP